MNALSPAPLHPTHFTIFPLHYRMTADQLKRLEADLWEAADQLRANSKLTATEYSMPILGLIFLRQASNRFDQVKKEVEATPSCAQWPADAAFKRNVS